jgi:hypothetical protein
MGSGASYFFFRRFAAFFATFFAFLFFAIAALLATICGDVGTVPSRIDVHCIPITPARRKKHRLHLTERVRGHRFRQTRTARARRRAHSSRTIARDDKSAHENSTCCENPYAIVLFVVLSHFTSSAHWRAETTPRRRLDVEKSCAVSFLPRPKIFFHRPPAEASTAVGFDQNRANRPQVIRSWDAARSAESSARAIRLKHCCVSRR